MPKLVLKSDYYKRKNRKHPLYTERKCKLNELKNRCRKYIDEEVSVILLNMVRIYIVI